MIATNTANAVQAIVDTSPIVSVNPSKFGVGISDGEGVSTGSGVTIHTGIGVGSTSILQALHYDESNDSR